MPSPFRRYTQAVKEREKLEAASEALYQAHRHLSNLTGEIFDETRDLRNLLFDVRFQTINDAILVARAKEAALEKEFA